MYRINLTLVISLILLAALATTPVTVIEDAFAKNGIHVDDLNRGASISNSCLNPVSNSNTNDNTISNGNCGGTISQQGKSGQASTPTTVQNANPTIDLQGSIGTSPGGGLGNPPSGQSCSGCFVGAFNSTQQRETFLMHLRTFISFRNALTLPFVCLTLNLPVNNGDVAHLRVLIANIHTALVDTLGPQSEKPDAIRDCLLRAYNLLT
jgi:hypothetical protein